MHIYTQQVSQRDRQYTHKYENQKLHFLLVLFHLFCFCFGIVRLCSLLYVVVVVLAKITLKEPTAKFVSFSVEWQKWQQSCNSNYNSIVASWIDRPADSPLRGSYVELWPDKQTTAQTNRTARSLQHKYIILLLSLGYFKELPIPTQFFKNSYIYIQKKIRV